MKVSQVESRWKQYLFFFFLNTDQQKRPSRQWQWYAMKCFAHIFSAKRVNGDCRSLVTWYHSWESAVFLLSWADTAWRQDLERFQHWWRAWYEGTLIVSAPRQLVQLACQSSTDCPRSLTKRLWRWSVSNHISLASADSWHSVRVALLTSLHYKGEENMTDSCPVNKKHMIPKLLD